MSTIFLHTGQCGNQIGKAFWKKTSLDPCVFEGHTFVHPDGIQRSIHVDSEPKVVQKSVKGLKVREGNVVSGKRGRGTNWALGYNGLKNKGEDHILEDTMNQVRKEIERCDMYSGCIMMHSLTGGTGSGLGSRLCEMMREEYPMNHLMSCTVAPCATGESPLQNYNALLTLSYLQRNTDCVILTHNDDVLGKLQRKMESVSFDNMNTAIASALAGVFLPTDTLTPKSGPSIGMEPWEMIRSVCPLPANKFVHVHQIAKSKLTWDGLRKQLSQGIRRHGSKGNVFSSIANVVIARGDSTETFYPTMAQGLEKKFQKTFNVVEWNPFPIDIWTAKANPIGPKEAASITVASNSEAIVEHLETVYDRSKVKFNAKAYLHWYNKYGTTDVTEDDGLHAASQQTPRPQTSTSMEISIYDTSRNTLPPLNTLGISTSSLMHNGELSIVILDYASAVLSKQFNITNGLIPPSTIQYQHIRGARLPDHQQVRPGVEAVQIHYTNAHYVTSHQNSVTGTITVYDSLYNPNRVKSMERQLRSVYASLRRKPISDIQYIIPQSQHATSDCGAFAIANAYLLLSSIQPQSINLQQPLLRMHILRSLTAQFFLPFPSYTSRAEYHKQYKKKQRENASFTSNENFIRNKSRRLNRQDEDFKSDENTKRNKTLGLKRQDPKYKANENAERNKTRGLKRQDEVFKSDENTKRNKTRGLKRQDEVFKSDENTKRNKTRGLKRQDEDFKSDENTKRNKTRGLKRQDEDFKSDENTKRNKTRGLKRQDEVFKSDENTKRNKTRGLKRQDEDFKSDENSKRNKTRGFKRQDEDFKSDENTKNSKRRGNKRKNLDFRTNENRQRNKSRKKLRRDPLYKTLENQKRRKKRKESNLISKLKNKFRLSTNRRNITFTLPIIQQLMFDLCKKGDEYICTSCNQTFYQHSVYLVSKDTYLKHNVPEEITLNCLTGKLSACSSEWICKTCHKYLLLKKIPPMSKYNGFDFPEYPQIIQTLNPTPTEERCCSLRIPFMQIKELGIGKQYGIFGNTVNVPMNPAEVVSALPRRLNETATIQLQFMRKTCYKRPYIHETIRPKVIFDITKHFIQTSDLYKEEKVQLNEDWLADFHNDEEVNYITSDTVSVLQSKDSENAPVQEQTPQTNNPSELSSQQFHMQELPQEGLSQSENTRQDQQQKLTSNSDSNVQNNRLMLETDTNSEDDWEEIPEEERAAGNCDTLLNHNDFSDDGKHALKLAPGEASHPVSLFFDEHAEEKSFPILYCGQKKPEHPIKVTYATECKAHIRNADRRFSTSTPNIFYKLKKLQTQQVQNSITVALRKRKESKIYTAQEILDDDNVNLMISKNEGFKILRSLRSSPAYFQEKQKDLFAMIRTLGIPSFFATFSAAETKWTDLLSLLYRKAHGPEPTEKQLSELTFMEKCSLIQKDPVTCARHFHFRTHFFFNNILGTSLSPLGTLKDYYYRVEFQNRGSPHLHCLFWIENAPVYELSEDEEVIAFIDKYITCSRTTNTEADDLSYLQTHKHTISCRPKQRKECRFGFPIPPLRKTLILKSLPKDMTKSEIAQHKSNFNTIKKILNDKTVDFNGLTFDEFLQKCQLDEETYIMALRSSISRNQVFLKREPSQARVNGYNPGVLGVWQANTDLQFILDPWAVCVYIASYLMKSQRGISKLLQKASDEAKRGNMSVRQQLKFVGNKFLNHCEISAQESIYLLLQMPLTQSSRSVMFVNTSEPENRTRILKPAHILRSLPKDSTDILCDGILQHYAQRPNVLKHLTLAEFSSQYDIRSFKHPPDVEVIDNTDNTVEDVQTIIKW